MVDNLSKTPDFVCSVSIEETDAAATLATLSVEGGVVNRKELYAWPANEGEKARLKDVLAVYAKACTGGFALYSRAVFLTVNATFYGAPDEATDNRRLLRLDFAMPREASTYILSREARGYSGSIWSDPDSLDVVRFRLQADDIPPDLGIKAITQIFEYGHVKMAENSVVLPVTSELRVLERSGREVRIVEHSSDCRQYIAAKRGNIYVETAADAPAKAAAPVPVLPAKLVLPMILTEPIDERTTLQGSSLSLTVVRDVKKSGKVIVPKGSTATGHVTRIIRQAFPTDFSTLKRYYLVGIQLDSMVAGDQRFQLWANLESLGPPPPPPADSIAFIPFSNDPNKWGTFDDLHTQFIVPPAVSGESFLGVVLENLRLPDRLVMDWSTTEPPR